MGKIKIYISLKDDELYYCDTEEHNGQTIETTVNPGDTIIWKTEKCSCIKEISDISIISEENNAFFSEGPTQKKPKSWKAKVSESAQGEIEYQISYIKNETSETESTKNEGNVVLSVKETEPPKIRIP